MTHKQIEQYIGENLHYSPAGSRILRHVIVFISSSSAKLYREISGRKRSSSDYLVIGQSSTSQYKLDFVCDLSFLFDASYNSAFSCVLPDKPFVFDKALVSWSYKPYGSRAGHYYMRYNSLHTHYRIFAGRNFKGRRYYKAYDYVNIIYDSSRRLSSLSSAKSYCINQFKKHYVSSFDRFEDTFRLYLSCLIRHFGCCLNYC